MGGVILDHCMLFRPAPAHGHCKECRRPFKLYLFCGDQCRRCRRKQTKMMADNMREVLERVRAQEEEQRSRGDFDAGLLA